MLGWLSLQSREPRAWDDQDCTLIDGVATDLSSALLQVVARDDAGRDRAHAARGGHGQVGVRRHRLT